MIERKSRREKSELEIEQERKIKGNLFIMNRQDQMVQFSQLYPDAYTQIVTQQGLYPKSTKYFILYEYTIS